MRKSLSPLITFEVVVCLSHCLVCVYVCACECVCETAESCKDMYKHDNWYSHAHRLLMCVSVCVHIELTAESSNGLISLCKHVNMYAHTLAASSAMRR